jgi:hypothetical protein
LATSWETPPILNARNYFYYYVTIPPSLNILYFLYKKYYIVLCVSSFEARWAGCGRYIILYFDNTVEDAVGQSLVDDNYDYRAETVAFAPSSHPACNGPAALLFYLCLSSCLSSCLPVWMSGLSVHAWLPACLFRIIACFYLICQFSLPNPGSISTVLGSIRNCSGFDPQLSWDRYQHPPTQWNLRGGR